MRFVSAILTMGLIATLSACGTSDGIEGLESFGRIEAGQHVEGSIQYDQSPPVGGKHNPIWQNCGIYDTPVRSENAVHSLEHGAVWITYRLNVPEDEVVKLRDLIRGRSHGLLSPYTGSIDKPIAITAWGYRLEVERADDPRLSKFIARFMQGPQTPEPGAPCSGGIGVPVG